MTTFFDFPNLTYSTFTFTAEVTEDILLSEYKGSVFRGGFGMSFKRLVCINKEEKNCFNCIVNKNCSYHIIFNTYIDEELSQRLKISRNAPRPFILEPPITTQRKFKIGDTLQFNAILVGYAVEFLPYFIIVFERLGDIWGIGSRVYNRKGKFKILSVKHKGEIIYYHQNKILKFNNTGKEKETEQTHDPVKKITLNFVTPTRLMLDNETKILRSENDFTTFIIRLYSRVFRLNELYGSLTPTPSQKEGESLNSKRVNGEYSHKQVEELSRKVKLTQSKLHWHDLKRPLNTIGTDKTLNELEWMKYGGFVGEVTFEGELTPFVSLIKLGEVLHVGKYYTFGLGKYEILEMN